MTRLWTEGVLVEVLCDGQGLPRKLTWEGQQHTVTAITRQWRVDSDWWRNRVWRAYYKLSTDSGLLLVIFEDLTTGEWYVQRLYD